MICAVERERSFCALKSFKVGFIGERSNVPFFGEICVVNLSCYFVHKWDYSRVCGKQRQFYPPVFLDFSIALEAIMMNVFNLLTQPVAPPCGHHRNGQERCPTDGKNVVMPQKRFGRAFVVWYYCWIIVLFNWCRRIYLILINILVNNEILRFIIECRVCFYLVE